jgi:hypothetical protein
LVNKGKSPASFWRQLAALFSDIFLQHLFSEKSQNLLKTQKPLKLDKKISTDLESLEFQNFLMHV